MALTDNLVAYYKFDENTGSTAWDSVGSNDGTISGATRTTWKINSWLSFDWTNDEVSLWNISSLFTTNEASLVMWVKLDVATPVNVAQTWFAAFWTDSARSHYPFTDGLAYIETFRSSRVNSISLSGSIDRTTWHMVTITTTPWTNWWKMYQNDTLIHQTTWEASVSIPTSSFIWKSVSAGGDSFIDWVVDEVWLRSRTLSSSEITELYNSWAWLQYPFSTANTTNFFFMM